MQNPISKGLFITALAALLSGGCFSQADTAGQMYAGITRSASESQCITPANSDRMADEVLQLVNLERTSIGLAPVESNPYLVQAASDYACRMIEGSFFGHSDGVSGDGPGDRVAASGYAFLAVGENLAAGQINAREAMADWMQSSAHRKIILDPRWKEVGIAVRSGGPYTLYWVQEFGDPADF